MIEEIDFWDMECVKISVKKQLDDLTYAQRKRNEEQLRKGKPLPQY